MILEDIARGQRRDRMWTIILIGAAFAAFVVVVYLLLALAGSSNSSPTPGPPLGLRAGRAGLLA
jgi:hypothetical protein